MQDVYVVLGKSVWVLIIVALGIFLMTRIVVLIDWLRNKAHNTRIHHHRVRVKVYCDECAKKGLDFCPMKARFDPENGFCSEGIKATGPKT